jgi:hypothetical protein
MVQGFMVQNRSGGQSFREFAIDIGLPSRV